LSVDEISPRLNSAVVMSRGFLKYCVYETPHIRHPLSTGGILVTDIDFHYRTDQTIDPKQLKFFKNRCHPFPMLTHASQS
jgi:hypothetical protein